ncbi:MAG TPA: response regulator [Candidatus Acidoferrales bacterium]|nr:response regulator [Candidatus Acidoferrales bacterium]
MAKNQQGKTGAGPVVFVVDDEEMLLDLAEMVLKPAGFSVRKFQDPKKALAEYAVAAPRVVITDYAMGPMNGLEVIQECRRLHPDQKIIMVSGTVDESVYANSEIKPDCFIAKPYDPHRFVAAVRKLADA